VEESLDVDMVSAICPNCHIILVEANSTSVPDLGTAVNTAVSLGARYVSTSYGSPEFSSETSYDSYYNHPGVAITASAGDSGYGVEYPAASRYVTAVGGTTLTTASNARGWSETAWKGTGSGCSAYEAKPSWQSGLPGCANRINTDVSADADPATGVAVYDTYSQGGWLYEGGTSAASPIIASVYALAGTPAPGTYPSSYIYAHQPAGLFDVTSGSNGSCSPAILCTAGAYWDGPTGYGTPNGTAAFTPKPTGAVAATTNQDGRVEIFATDPGGVVYHDWQVTPGGGWSGWSQLASNSGFTSLAASTNQDGRLEVFATTANGVVYHNYQTAPNSGWSGWSQLAGAP
jgi:subtilase family serine protease